jgi:TolA-binding protein
MARLTKRQIKEDRFVSGLLKSQEYFNQHKSQIILGAVAVLVLALVVVLVVTNSRAAQRQAADDYGAASMYIREFYNTFEADMNQDGLPDASLDSSLAILKTARTELEEIISKHGGSKQAKFATFYLASVNFKLSDYERAESYYQRFLDKYYIDENFDAAAKCGIAGCRESMRDFEAAGNIYLEVAKEYPQYTQHIETLYKATLNLAKAGMKEEALEAFELLGEIPAARNQTKNARVFLYEKKILDPYTYDIK